MSHTETHFGKLKRVEIGDLNVEEWCKERCNEIGINEIEPFNNSWEEELRDNYVLGKKYHFIKKTIWEIFDHTESEGDYINMMIPNSDGTFTFCMQFYNGGTCLSEMIEEGLSQVDLKK